MTRPPLLKLGVPHAVSIKNTITANADVGVILPYAPEGSKLNGFAPRVSPTPHPFSESPVSLNLGGTPAVTEGLFNIFGRIGVSQGFWKSASMLILTKLKKAERIENAQRAH